MPLMFSLAFVYIMKDLYFNHKLCKKTVFCGYGHRSVLAFVTCWW